MTATLKRIEALLGGAPEPPRRRSAARRSLSPAKRRASSPRKKAVDADLPPPPPPPTRGHRGCYDRAFRTSNSFSLAWPDTIDLVRISCSTFPDGRRGACLIARSSRPRPHRRAPLLGGRRLRLVRLKLERSSRGSLQAGSLDIKPQVSIFAKEMSRATDDDTAMYANGTPRRDARTRLLRVRP